MDAKLFVGMPTRGRPNHYADRAAMYIAQQAKGMYDIRQSWAVTSGRNGLVGKFLASDYTHLLFVDDDTILPHDTYEKLLAVDAPMVTGVYPMVYNGAICLSALPLGWAGAAWPEPWIDGVWEAEHCGLGCVLIRREVLEVMEYPYFTWLETKEGGYVGEDVHFCRAVRKNGFRIMVEGDVRCGHEKSVNLLDIVPAAGRMRARCARHLREFLTPESQVTDVPGAEAFRSRGVGSEHEVSTFLGAMVYLLKPTSILETGTHEGQTAFTMGLAAQVTGASVITIDISHDKAIAAAQLCKGLPVDCGCMNSLDYVAANPHDFLFLDCTHPEMREPVLQHLIETKSLVHGAWIVIHDVIPKWGGYERYLKYVTQPLVLPCPRGLFIGRLK